MKKAIFFGLLFGCLVGSGVWFASCSDSGKKTVDSGAEKSIPDTTKAAPDTVETKDAPTSRPVP